MRAELVSIFNSVLLLSTLYARNCASHLEHTRERKMGPYSHRARLFFDFVVVVVF